MLLFSSFLPPDGTTTTATQLTTARVFASVDAVNISYEVIEWSVSDSVASLVDILQHVRGLDDLQTHKYLFLEQSKNLERLT